MNASALPVYARLLCCLSLTVIHAAAREFTDVQGRKLDADLVSVAGDQVTLKRTTDGRVFTVSAKQFTAEDQKVFAEFARTNVRFAFDVKYSRTKLGKTKSRQGVMQYETEEWAYKVQLINKSSADATEVKLNYWIFRRDDDGKNKGAPRVQKGGSVAVPVIRRGATHEFQTESVTLNKSQLDADYYNPDGSRNKSSDSVGGFALRVMQGDREIYHYATKDDLLPLAQGDPKKSTSAADNQ